MKNKIILTDVKNWKPTPERLKKVLSQKKTK